MRRCSDLSCRTVNFHERVAQLRMCLSSNDESQDYQSRLPGGRAILDRETIHIHDLQSM